MNYISAVYGVVTAIVLGYWWIQGKHVFRVRVEKQEGVNRSL